jgi:hypothetical protein
MSQGELVGTLGVSLLLLAFALNLAKKLDVSSVPYLLLNITGAALAGISSYMISFWPFVILEGVWTVSSLVMLIKSKTNHETN